MNTNLTIRLDKDVKEKAQAVLSSLGMDLSSAINIFLRQVILKDGIPFSIDRGTVNKETYRAMKESYNGKNLSKGFESVDTMMKTIKNK